MLSERILTRVMRSLSAGYLDMKPAGGVRASLPGALDPKKASLLYVHIPFCEKLCPYCSFCRYPFNDPQAKAYFKALRKEMKMVAQLGYNIESLYIGGGTPTILVDELAQTIDLAGELFNIREVSCETNPNHLTPAYLDVLDGRVQRLSVGVQSFDDDLLKQIQRYDKYGSGMEILERLIACEGRFESLNADMMFNFPTQTEDVLIHDLACILESGVSQTTYYPLMVSPAVADSLESLLGRVNYQNEAAFYELICRVLTTEPGFGQPDSTDSPDSMESNTFKLTTTRESAPYIFGSAWTFNSASEMMIDEYIVDYEEYPAIGAGGFSYLGGNLYANTFSVDEYISQVESGQMSVKQRNQFSKQDRMRYRLMMQLFGLELDKVAWKADFGVSVSRGLPAEYAFLKAVGAFDVDDDIRITLTAKGRYLLVALMREFFIGVNTLRDIARQTLASQEQDLLFN